MNIFIKIFLCFFSLVFINNFAMAKKMRPLQAIDLPRGGESYHFIDNGQDLAAALRLFARNLGIGINLDSKLTGQITSHKNTNVTYRKYLDNLAEEFGFIWFFDGSILYITGSHHMETDVFPLKNNNGPQLVRTLNRLGLYQPQFLHRYDERNWVLMVSGPAVYVELIKKAIKAIESADHTNITILRGSSESSSTPSIKAPALSQISQPSEAISQPVNSN